MRKLWSSVIGVVAIAACLIGLNLLADRFLAGARLDLTAQQIYTLSPGTRKIVASLKDPVTLRLFYSRQLGAQVPVYGAYADRVREMLRDYAALSDGKIRLEIYDPEPFTDVEDRALGYGLQGVPIDRTGTQVYFGLAGTNLLDDQRVVPFFQPDRERFLEFDLTRLVQELSHPKLPVVGVLTSLPLDGDLRSMSMLRQQPGSGPWASMLQLRQGFDVKMLQPDVQAIPPEVQVLLVAHAQHLDDTALYAIDQFVMRGGKLMAMVDPKNEAQSAVPDAQGAPQVDTASDLGKLFDAWGIEFDPTTVIGDLTNAWRVRAGAADRVQSVDYVPWFNIRDPGIARDDPALADIAQIGVAAPGALAKKKDAAIDFVPLLTSSPQSGPIVAESLVLPDPVKLLSEFKPAGGPRVIGARVRGVLNSAFKQPPPAPEGRKRPDDFPPHKARTDAPANLVLFADSDILTDRFWVRMQDFFGQQQPVPFSDNGPMLANLVGTLAGGDDLIGLRARGASLRPFEVVDDMQRRAEATYRQTEQALQQHLEETEKKLTDLRSGTAGEQKAAVITAEQRAAIDDLQREIVATRGRLRGVQLDLRRDIDGLETRLRLFNIVLVPALLTAAAIALSFARGRRRALARA